MHRGSWVLVAALLLGCSACARRGGGAPQPAGIPVQVEVTNQYGAPMEVFAVGAGTSHRLGIVDPGMVRRFEVPQTLVGNGPVEFQAHPSASTRLVRSGEVLLAPGAFVDFVITAQLFNSSATLRR